MMLMGTLKIFLSLEAIIDLSFAMVGLPRLVSAW